MWKDKGEGEAKGKTGQTVVWPTVPLPDIRNARERVWERENINYSSTPLSMGDKLQDPYQMPEAVGTTEPYVYYVFSLNIHTYDKI